MPEVDLDGDRGRDYRLRRDEPVAAGLARIAAGRAEEALERLGKAGAGEAGAAAIHGARKDMKKVRALLRLLREPLGAAAFERANRRFRDAGRALSASRDAEAKLQTLSILEAPPQAALSSWRKILERDRDAAVDSRAERSGSAEAMRLIEAGLEEVRAWELPEGSGREGSWELISAGALRTYRSGRAAMRSARRTESERALHEWRKRSKDLWYQLRIVGEAWPRLLDPAAEEAHVLSELLGGHHDLALLRADLGQRRLGAAEAEALAAGIAERQRRLAAEALRRGRRLYAERPGAYQRRLRAYWQAWRG